MYHRIALLSLFALGTIQAQQPHTVVTGVVYDSVASAPLSGAVVQVVAVDTSAGAVPRAYSAVSDAAGHYLIANLPSGKFAIGFQPQALDALRIELPVRGFV